MRMDAHSEIPCRNLFKNINSICILIIVFVYYNNSENKHYIYSSFCKAGTSVSGKAEKLIPLFAKVQVLDLNTQITFPIKTMASLLLPPIGAIGYLTFVFPAAIFPITEMDFL